MVWCPILCKHLAIPRDVCPDQMRNREPLSQENEWPSSNWKHEQYHQLLNRIYEEDSEWDQGSQLSVGVMLCCLSLGVFLAPISLSLPYPHPLVLFIPWVTLCFYLFQIPWSLCDPSASLLPHVPLLTLIFLWLSPYSSFLIVSSYTINHPLPVSLLTRLLIPLCLTFPSCIVDQYRLPVILYKPQ